MNNEQLAILLSSINRSLKNAIEESRQAFKDSEVGEERKNLFGGTYWAVDELSAIESEQYQIDQYIKALSNGDDLTT